MKTELKLLQTYRGLAALLVLVHHVGVMSKLHLNTPFLGGVFAPGHIGVDFFFVLSGFIIWYVHADDLGKPERARRYLLKRFFRIYPVLFICSTAKLLYMLLLGSGVPEVKMGISTIISSYLLLPSDGRFLIDAAWTLTFEAFFYAVFLLFILLGRGFALATIIIWATCIVLLNLTFPPEQLGFLPQFIFHPFNIQFVLGCVAAHLSLCTTRLEPMKWPLLLLGLVLLGSGLLLHRDLLEQPGLFQKCYWGLVFFLIVLASVLIEASHRPRTPKPLTVLGDASYSVYLLHSSLQVPLILVFNKFAWFTAGNTQLLLVGVAVISLIGALQFWRFVERPLLELTNTAVSRVGKSPQQVLT